MISISLFLLALVDQFTHRVPNRLLFAILIESIALSECDFNLSALFLCAMATPILWKCGVGGGDIKLLALILVFLKPSLFAVDYCENLLLTTSILGIISIVRNQSSRERIPFAPAIVAAYLLSI